MTWPKPGCIEAAEGTSRVVDCDNYSPCKACFYSLSSTCALAGGWKPGIRSLLLVSQQRQVRPLAARLLEAYNVKMVSKAPRDFACMEGGGSDGSLSWAGVEQKHVRKEAWVSSLVWQGSGP